MARWIGSVLKGTYRVDGVLGEGGMGVVYRGVHLTLGKHIAIKTLIPGAGHSSKARERFQREALLGSKLAHPAVAQVFDFGVEEEVPFIVMEYVEGVELTDVIAREAPMSPQRAISVMMQIAGVLCEAERHQLLHRDIKPQNIRILNYKSDQPLAVKVLDFGIAKSVGTDQEGLTTAGNIIGTPRYLAPEQVNTDGKNIDCRSDQYSSGILFYELLTGSVPFKGETVASLLLAHVNRPPAPLPPTVPEPLRRVVMRMLSKAPDDRYPNAIALEKALLACNAYLSGTPAEQLKRSLGPSLETEEAASPTPLRTRILVGTVLLVALGTLTIYALQRVNPQRPLTAPAVKAGATSIVENTEPPQTPDLAQFPPDISPTQPLSAPARPSITPLPVQKTRPKPAQKADPFDVEIAR